jgi:hypothetical protein
MAIISLQTTTNIYVGCQKCCEAPEWWLPKLISETELEPKLLARRARTWGSALAALGHRGGGGFTDGQVLPAFLGATL